jgi:hypothetical protein
MAKKSGEDLIGLPLSLPLCQKEDPINYLIEIRKNNRI